ncbi:MAG: Uma2 family endonuclease [Planctomycetales bacterium]|nr:Uma2 family endonuclease [Planctomycetales bacterium]
MSTASHFQPISVRDYLDGERTAKHKHEYVNGVVYAMVGETNLHNRIATNATGALGGLLRGKPCQVFNSDTKIRIRQAQGTRFYYPDASVVCHRNASDETFQDSPVVVIEVISESTRRTDEYEKREAYLGIDSLCVYILAEQASAAAIVYRRLDSGFGRETYLGRDAVISLPEITCTLPLAELYEDVEFPEPVSDDETGEWL